jgi:tRNA-specific 2-thiouridylase
MVGRPVGLARGLDRGKDQSYFLAKVAPAVLRQILFPLVGLTKADVRALAERAGFGSSLVHESQEICFLPHADYRDYLRQRLGELPGAVVDREGKVLGTHRGTYNFTIGQRRGLGIAAGEPLYVVGLDAERREVVVAAKTGAAVSHVSLGDVVVHRPPGGARMWAQVRSTGDPVPARLGRGEEVIFDRPTRGVAPGQIAVLYEGERVILAGTITAATWARGTAGPAGGAE